MQVAKDPAYVRETLLSDTGGAALQHSSSHNFTGSSRRTVGRGMRSMTSKVSNSIPIFALLISEPLILQWL